MGDSVNRVKANCAVCGLPVPALGGVAYEYPPATEREMGEVFEVRTDHLACHITGRPEVVAVRNFAGELVGIVSRTGRCEDAPCCGCCGDFQ